ncbi:MAG TPA: Rieske 2Fe-2S domain-containing protein [Kofleriaceae bacterium]
MLSAEVNHLLTQTGAGTPLGALFRRYWLPALRADELPVPDCAPVRVRLLGEDLVAFRDTAGRVGLLEEHCPHRRTSLFLGRNEDGGLRCVYHGWKFSVDGKCLDMPSEPACSTFKDKVRATSYPCVERGGVVWAYLGPAASIPEPPSFEWTLVRASHRLTTRWLQGVNFLQALEGALDSSHLSFLHRGNFAADYVPDARGPAYIAESTAPEFHLDDADHGLVVAAKRPLSDGTAYWRVTQYVMPTFVLVPPNARNARNWLGFVPVDDATTCCWAVSWQPAQPMSAGERDRLKSGVGLHLALIPGTLTPKANRENGYLQNRALQATGASFTGIPGVGAQDFAVVDSAGTVCDRTKERLGTSDRAIIAARELLATSAHDVARGRVPRGSQPGTHLIRSASFVGPVEATHSDREDLLAFDRDRDLTETGVSAP